MLSAGWRYLKLTMSGVSGRRRPLGGSPRGLRGSVGEGAPAAAARELYESLLRNHIRPYLGGRSLDKTNSQVVRTWRERLFDDGRTPIIAAKSYRLLRAVLNPRRPADSGAQVGHSFEATYG